MQETQPTQSAMPQPANFGKPAMQQTKTNQANMLAELIPQIMNAIGGGDQRTSMLLAQQQEANRKRIKEQNQKNFMRAVVSPHSGEITPELIMQQAQLFGVDPKEALGLFQQLDNHRKQKAKLKSDQEALSLGRQVKSGALPLNQILQNPDISDEVAMSVSGMIPEPKDPEMFKSFNPDGSFTWMKKELGSSGMPKPDDRSYGWIGRADGSKEYSELSPGAVSLPAPKSGIEIETGPDGTTRVKTGVPGNQSVLTRTVKTDMQKKLLEANQTYSDLKATVNKYDDSFLKGKDKLGYFATAFKEKWEIGDVSPEDKQKLADYTTFRRESIATLNKYINQITGAAMSADEAKRLLKGMPNPGMRLFDGDSPTEFKSKMAGVMQQLDRVIARSNYVLRHGLKSFESVPLGSMDRIIDSRGEEIETELTKQHPNKQTSEIEKMTVEILSKEFGIRF